ncbi:YoaK family protein [Sphingomonas sp.]|uniref:YoaK family protein n=1 Tax=Sphingomonas sp. TaxID=28214 RepID=UPI0031E16750
MIRSDRRTWPLAISLAMLAGYVDAIGFQHLGGYFVSFMSGNGTMLAVHLVRPGTMGGGAAMLAALLGLFVAGVMAGTLIRLAVPHGGQAAVLILVAVLLALAGLASWLAWGMAVAMGAANATFERDGEVSIGVTYMTGTLVKIGQHLAQAVAGGARWRWLPYLLLWSGFMAGAALGAWAYPAWGMAALGVATGGAMLAAAAAWRSRPVF